MAYFLPKCMACWDFFAGLLIRNINTKIQMGNWLQGLNLCIYLFFEDKIHPSSNSCTDYPFRVLEPIPADFCGKRWGTRWTGQCQGKISRMTSFKPKWLISFVFLSMASWGFFVFVSLLMIDMPAKIHLEKWNWFLGLIFKNGRNMENISRPECPNGLVSNQNVRFPVSFSGIAAFL